MMKCGLFEEVIQSNQFNYKQIDKQLIGAPLKAEQYCVDKDGDKQ